MNNQTCKNCRHAIQLDTCPCWCDVGGLPTNPDAAFACFTPKGNSADNAQVLRDELEDAVWGGEE